jgi:prepilin-type processing-associated H-X9-DG protein
VKSPFEVVLLYDRPDAGRQRVLAFADGHVAKMPAHSAELNYVWQQTNAARKAQKLPELPLDFSGPPPAVP